MDVEEDLESLLRTFDQIHQVIIHLIYHSHSRQIEFVISVFFPEFIIRSTEMPLSRSRILNHAFTMRLRDVELCKVIVMI